jgi:hypothetical protein
MPSRSAWDARQRGLFKDTSRPLSARDRLKRSSVIIQRQSWRLYGCWPLKWPTPTGGSRSTNKSKDLAVLSSQPPPRQIEESILPELSDFCVHPAEPEDLHFGLEDLVGSHKDRSSHRNKLTGFCRWYCRRELLGLLRRPGNQPLASKFGQIAESDCIDKIRYAESCSEVQSCFERKAAYASVPLKAMTS